MSSSETPFWHTKTLNEMSRNEWESLCDGCGRCCLNKIIDTDDQVHTTAVACRLLDLDSCRCKDYPNRKREVSDCIKFSRSNLQEHMVWLPDSCAYRLLSEGYDLPEWHPLVTGDPESVHKAGFSARGMAVSEIDYPHPEQWQALIIRTE